MAGTLSYSFPVAKEIQIFSRAKAKFGLDAFNQGTQLD